MFRNQIPLFSVLGFKIKLDLSWLLLATLITWSLATGYFPQLHPGWDTGTYWSLGLVGMIGLMMSLLLHELSHALVARTYGLPVGGITLFIFGGVAELQNEPESAKTEFWVAIAGPIASFTLAGLFYLSASFAGAGAGPETPPFAALLAYLAIVNLILAIFNLIPAFPLDGGRVLRAALWSWRGDLAGATKAASQVGNGFGLLLIIAGILFILTGNLIGGAWWVVIGLFMRSAATGSYYQTVTTQALDGQPISQFMTREVVTVAPDVALDRFVDDYLYRRHHDMFPVVQNGRLLGAAGPRQVRQIARDQWRETAVGDIMTPLSDSICVDPDRDTADVLQQMQRSGQTRLMVVRRGEIVGLVTLKDIMAVLQLRMDLAG